MPSRRDFLRQLAAASAAIAIADAAGARGEEARETGLNDLAKEKGLFYGAAVNGTELRSQASTRLILQQCGLVVAQGAQKWSSMWKNQKEETPEDADALASFAQANHLKLRAHALIFASKLPAWVEQLSASELRVAFNRRITYACTRWKGRVHSWDVVNEAILPEDGRADGLRNSIFLQKLGSGYIADAFSLARQTDPSAMLCYNDFGLESNTEFARKRRRSLFSLLEDLKKRGAPIDALGIQGHLRANTNFNDKDWIAFLREVSGLGLKIIISELDVFDRDFPADIKIRDRDVAELTSRFLQATLDVRDVIGVVTWGLSDDHSWLLSRLKAGERMYTRSDSALPRPLPFDADLRKKPMWYAIADAFKSAPDRR